MKITELSPMKMPKDIKKYGNKWVALDLKREKVIASGSDLGDVDKKAEKLTNSQDKFILSRIPDPTKTYSP